MGCFSVSCGVSGISLYNDEACFIPIDKSPYFDHNINDRRMIMGEGCSSLFCPVGLPIYGVLDTYGRLDAIERNKNVELIEKYYGKPIEEWQERCGMFVHRDIYERFQRIQNAYEESDMVPEVLEFMGFKFIEKKERERYKLLYINDKYPNLCIYSDGTWIEIELDHKKANEFVYRPKFLVEYIQKTFKTKFPKKIIDELKSSNPYRFVYDKALKQFKKDRDNEYSYRGLLAKRLGEKADGPYKLGEEIGTNDYQIYLLNFGRSSFVKDHLVMYQEHFDDPYIKEEFLRFNSFQTNMFLVNKLFMPSFSGPQHGEYEIEKIMHEQALITIGKILKKYDE